VDTSKLSVGDQIAVVSGIVLIIALFLPWYGVDVNIGPVSASQSANAWEALSLIDILLLLVGVIAVGVPVAKAMGSFPDEVSAPVLVLGAGAVGLVLVLFRLIDLPTPDLGGGVDFGRKWGIFVGLLATAGVAYGGWRANEETTAGTTSASAPPPPAAPPAAS
jgi:hypothetical protein